MLLASGKGTYEPLNVNTLDTETAARICRQVLQATHAEGWQMGSTRVFLRAGQLALLEVSICRKVIKYNFSIQHVVVSMSGSVCVPMKEFQLQNRSAHRKTICI